MLISRKALAREKLEQLKNGQTAYAETSEVSQYIEKELASMNLDVVIDRTERGNWFYPNVDDSSLS
jgi:hypothetical protein